MKEDTSRLFKKTYFQPETILHSMNICKKIVQRKLFQPALESGFFVYINQLFQFQFRKHDFYR